MSGRFSHQAGLDRPNDAGTIPRDARDIFGRDFWPMPHHIAVTHWLLDTEPPLKFRVWDRRRWVLPMLIDDPLQGPGGNLDDLPHRDKLLPSAPSAFHPLALQAC